jgi:Flp pilus assembly protein TadB
MPFKFMAIIAAATAALIFSLVAMLSWQGSLMVVVAAATLAGGVVFTVLEMRSLARGSRRVAADLPDMR